MSNAWGKALDQASIVKAGFNDLEKAAIKGTRHKMRVPKEKHVRRLVIYTHERTGPIGDLYLNLVKRLEQPDWIIVLKTLIVFHRVFQGGNIRFLEDLSHRGNIFPLVRFTDMTTTQAHQQSVFIRKYSAYLEEKVFAYKESRSEFEKDTFTSKGLTVEQLLQKIPKIQRQFDALLGTHVDEVCDNIITINAFELLLRDSFKMYCNLNEAVLNILELYFRMTKKDATKALEIYKVFMRETDAIINFFSASRRKFHIDLPELSPAPSTVVSGLEEYLRDFDESVDPSQNEMRNGSNSNVSSRGSNQNYNSNNNYNSNVGSNNGNNNSVNNGSRGKTDELLINFDDDLFANQPPPQQQQVSFQTVTFNQPQQPQQPITGFFSQQGNNNNNMSNKNLLDPFQVSNANVHQSMNNNFNNNNMNNNSFNNTNINNNNGGSSIQPLSQNYHNPFDPSYNEKALQIKAAFQSSNSLNGSGNNLFNNNTNLVNSNNNTNNMNLMNNRSISSNNMNNNNNTLLLNNNVNGPMNPMNNNMYMNNNTINLNNVNGNNNNNMNKMNSMPNMNLIMPMNNNNNNMMNPMNNNINNGMMPMNNIAMNNNGMVNNMNNRPNSMIMNNNGMMPTMNNNNNIGMNNNGMMNNRPNSMIMNNNGMMPTMNNQPQQNIYF